MSCASSASLQPHGRLRACRARFGTRLWRQNPRTWLVSVPTARPDDPAAPASALLSSCSYLRQTLGIQPSDHHGHAVSPECHPRPLSYSMGSFCAVNHPTRDLPRDVLIAATSVPERPYRVQRREHIGSVRRAPWREVRWCLRAVVAATSYRLPLLIATGQTLPLLSVLLYSSTGEVTASDDGPTDSNTYRPFKTLDATVMKSLAERLESFGDAAEEGKQLMLHAYRLSKTNSPRRSTHWYCWMHDEGSVL